MEGLSKAEFERQLVERFGWKQPVKPVITDPLDNLSPDDVRDLLPDLLRAFSGRKNRTQHPLLPYIFRQELSLNQIYSRAGMTASDFLSAMADSLSILALPRFESANADISKCALDTDVGNFKSHELASLSMPAVPETFENDELPTLPFSITEAPSRGKLRTFAGKVKFSKAIWSSYGEMLSAAISEYASTVFPALEMKLLAELLEGSTLAQTTQGTSYAGLDTAVKSLRTQKNSAGQTCNYALNTVLVPPDLEVAMRAAKESLGWQSLSVITNGYLTSPTTFFAMADPARSSAILRLKLRGEGAPKVYSSRNAPSLDSGVSFAVEHDVAFALSRPAPCGVLKCVAG